MKMDKWEMQSAPLDTPQGKTFKMYQGDTTKLSESSKDKKKLHEIGTMTVYKDVPYVEVEMKNKKMSFKVPEDVAKDLLVLKTLGKNPERFIIILSSLGLKLLIQVQRSVRLYGLVRRRSKFHRRRIQGVGCILNPSECSSCYRSKHRRKLVQE